MSIKKGKGGATLALLALAMAMAAPLQAQEAVDPAAEPPVPIAEDSGAETTATIPVTPIRADATELDSIEVTGSRIKQVDMEGPLPVTIITRADIDASGDLTVSDYLRRMDFNSFGSFTASSGSSGGAQGGAQISLRGLGEERTLVLVDGRRLPASPAFAGAAANLNVIPLALVERVEILREGASAIYGSDAIGGVINIITRRNYEGLQVSGQLERPSAAGGDAAAASLVWGASTDKSSIYVSLEHAQKDIIYMRDRDYTRGLNSAIGNPGTITSATDAAGNEVDVPGPFPNCPTAFGTDPDFPDSAAVNGFCRYRFASDAGQTAAVSRDTLSVGGTYQLGDDLDGFARMTTTRAESFGRFAAAPITNPVTMDAANPNNPTRNNPDYAGCGAGGCDIAFIFRPTDNGTRDNTVVDAVTQLLGGVKGGIELPFVGYSTWETGVFHNRYTQREIGMGYGLVREFQQAVDSGEYNPFDTTDPDNSGRSFDYTITSDNSFVSKGIDAQIALDSIAGEAFRLPLVLGGEYRREDFQTISDAQSAQSISFDESGNITSFVESNVFGSAGGSAQGARDYFAFYGESAVDFLEGLVTLDVALRYDSYSLGGSATSPKVSLALRPTEEILIRTSFSQGFRAPDLASLFGSPSQSFEDAVDRVGCDADPADDEACDVNQRKTAFDSNRQLKPEKSDNYNFGVVWNVLDDLSVSLDVYRIELEDAISTLTVQAVLDNEFRCAEEGRDCDPFSEGRVIRNDDGTINFVYSPATNAAKVETQGVDLGAQYGLPTPFGRFGADLSVSYVDSFKQQDSADGELIERADTVGVPELRGTLQLGWKMDAYFANVVGRYIHKTKDCAPLDVQNGDPMCEESVPSFTTWDGQLGWDTPWDGTITAGVRNVFDRQPSVSDFRRGATDSGVDFTLYDIDGRVPFVRYTQSF